MNTIWWEPGALNEERVTDCIVKGICVLEEHRLVDGSQSYGWTVVEWLAYETASWEGVGSNPSHDRHFHIANSVLVSVRGWDGRDIGLTAWSPSLKVSFRYCSSSTKGLYVSGVQGFFVTVRAGTAYRHLFWREEERTFLMYILKE